ncbi:hypothetical protein OsJ_33306 [Oryza sativa Japonica Group]|uniref:Transcriptional corepressor SEUSS n=3 Tax=Oryza sativa TaxID=4530 RepID=B9G9X1_ORYSJ|nr:hypothetical protein OsJ_33306 [Oryza sativa Japonica Group]
MEQPTSDPSAFLQQQQQQQHLLQLTKQNPQAAAAAQLNLLQQQRILQMQQQQQQQQQQILKNLPLQRNQLQQQQLLRQQSLNMRTPGKSAPYEPGTCAKRLTHYMYHQQNRPQDNNIEYWRNFVNEYFSPNAKKRWCVSLYGSGRQTTGVFPQDVWHCEICNRKPGRGFETTVEVLPRLCQIKYASGTLEELLYVDMPRESQNASGQIVLDYTKAIQESVFEQLRVVREGHLRIVFNPDLKIASWEFCARRHEELIPRRSIIPQVSQLGAVVQKYQSAVQNSTNLSTQDMQNNCNSNAAPLLSSGHPASGRMGPTPLCTHRTPPHSPDEDSWRQSSMRIFAHEHDEVGGVQWSWRRPLLLEEAAVALKEAAGARAWGGHRHGSWKRPVVRAAMQELELFSSVSASIHGRKNISAKYSGPMGVWFVACARQLAKALEVPLVNDLGYTKRYVRCLQIAEVVNCMKDLIDYSRQNGSGPIASLHSFPRRTSSGVSPHQSQQQQPEEQQSIPQSSNQSGQNAAPMTGVQASASANADVTSNNSLSCAPSTSAPSPSVVGLLQGSMNSRQDHPMSSANGPYTSGNSAAIPKVNSTTSLQSNPSTSFPSPMPTTSNNNMMPAPQSTNQLSSPTTSSNLPPMQPPATRPQEPEPNESQSSVQRILQDLMMSPQMNGIGQLGNDMKRPNGLTSSVNGVNCLVGNAVTNNSGMGGMGFGAMGGLGPNHAASGLRTAMVNNAMAISGRMGMNHSAHDLSQLGQLQQQQQHQQQQQQQQHDLGNQLLNGLRAANSFNNLQYDWKPSQ